MDFCSDYVYDYDNEEYEYISDEEYEQGMNVSDSDSDSDGEPRTLRLSAGPPSCAMEGVPPPPPASSSAGLFSFGGGTGSNLFSRAAGMFGSKPADSGPAAPPPPPMADSASVGGLFGAKPLEPRRQKKAKVIHHWKSAPASGSFSEQPPQQPQHRAHFAQQGRRVRRADTNIVSIKLNKLVSPSNMHAGDPEYCTQCRAILSKISKLQQNGDEKIWECEFCDNKNMVDVESEEIPAEMDVTYMLEPALSTTASGPSGMDESLVIFCVDVSGSMCVTTEVPGKINLRGGESLHRMQRMNTDRSDQYLPGQRRNVTYVSRLQSVQAAVDHQLEEMMKEKPNRRVALITFNNEVVIVGDGKGTPITVAGDKLTDAEELKKVGGELELPSDVKSTRKCLGDKVFDLEEGGGTALGPALLIATTMAAKCPGSKVVLCTDGLANVGLGKLEHTKSEEEVEKSVQFYKDLGETAVEKGVSVSVITIKGTDCKLVHLGQLADTTGGQVNIVDPLKLTEEFSNILANNIIATNVVATFVLHKGLYFHYEETEESKVVKTIGNVTAETEITFEYGVRAAKQKKTEKTEESPAKQEASGGDGSKVQGQAEEGQGQAEGGKEEKMEAEESEKSPKELPFQLQIMYTDSEGAKALRVLTQTKPVTKDRKKAEKKLNLDILGKHTAQVSAQLALQGEYTQARSRALMNQRVAWRNINNYEENRHQKGRYKSLFGGKVKPVENQLQQAQMKEIETRGCTWSDDEEFDSDDEADVMPQRAFAASSSAGEAKAKGSKFNFLSKAKKKKAQRSSETTDETAAMLFKAKYSK